MFDAFNLLLCWREGYIYIFEIRTALFCLVPVKRWQKRTAFFVAYYMKKVLNAPRTTTIDVHFHLRINDYINI